MKRHPAAAACALGALLLTSTAADAQRPVAATVTMSVDRTEAQVGELLRLEVRADVQGATNPQIEMPDLSAFDVIGRESSTPVQFRFGFGSRAQTIQATVVERLTLRARQPGTFDVRPARVLAGNRQFASNPLRIRVGGSGAPSGDPTPPGAPTDFDVVTGEFDPDGFVQTAIDHGEPYIGQQTTVTIYLYVRDGLTSSPTVALEPTTDGFWVQDLLPAARTLEGTRQVVRGQMFNVYVLRRFAAFPLRAGELSIGPLRVEVTTGDPFGGFFGGPGPRQLVRSGQPAIVRARELPAAGRPDGPIHVGDLALTAELDRTQVGTGDAVQLTVTARGTGALQQLQLEGPSADGLRVLEPEVDQQIEAPNDIVGGARIMRWLIVPEREGTFPVGPIAVGVFDPRTGTYSRAVAPALRLVAAGNPIAPTDDAAPARPTREGTRELTLPPIRTHAALTRGHRRWADHPALGWTLAIGPMIFALALGVRTARRRATRNDPNAAPKRARKEAQRRLAAAQSHAAANQPREFYGAVAQAIKEVLQGKLGRPVGSLTYPELRRVLVERGMETALAERIVDELEGSDFARFSAAGVTHEEMQRCLVRTREVLEGLDRYRPRPEAK